MEIDDDVSDKEENGVITTVENSQDPPEPAKLRSYSVPKPFIPVFVFVKIIESTGSTSVKYTILSQKVSEERKREVQRQYEDFEWLHHNIVSQCSLHGIVVPPLPARVNAQEKTPTRKPASSDASTPDQNCQRDVENLERYVQLLVVHPVFGSTALLNEFLTQTQPATRTKVRKGFMELIQQATDAKADPKTDVEEDLRHEYSHTSDLVLNLRDCHLDFDDSVLSNQRISVAYGHLSSTLQQTVPLYTSDSPSLVHYFKTWSALCDDTKKCIYEECCNEDRTLGSLLEHYTDYMQSAKDMLDRRLKLLYEYEEASRALDKAKPHKKESAEEGKSIAAAALSQCSDVARRELKDFHRARLLATQDALVRHAEHKLQAARTVHELVDRALNKLRAA